MRALAESLGTFLDQHVVVKGLFGLSALGSGVGISLAVAIQWLQVVSLMVGIAVGIATFVSIVRRNSK